MDYHSTPELVIDILHARIISSKGKPVAVLDPWCNNGTALANVTSDFPAVRYGIEPDNELYEAASKRLDHVLHSPIEECRVANKAFSLIFLNPPYEEEHSEDCNGKPCERKEFVFLKRCIPWIAPEGILIYIIPETSWNDSLRNLLAHKFDDIEAWRASELDLPEFQRIVVIGRRKECDCPGPLPTIGEIQDFLSARHVIPVSNPDVKLFRSARVSLEDMQSLVTHSSGWKNFLEKSRGRAQDAVRRRPPLPLHAGHMGLMIAAGALDGVMRFNGHSHVVKGKVSKTTSTSESQDINAKSGETIKTRRELFEYRVTVKLLDATGSIRELE